MKPEHEKAIRAIFADATAKHGQAFADAVDMLACTFEISEHAAAHCETLQSQVVTFGATALMRWLAVNNLTSKSLLVKEYAARIVAIPDAPPASDAPAVTPTEVPPGHTVH